MRRINWFTRHPIQSKYLFIVMMSMLGPTLLISGCLYFLLFRLMAEQIALPEAIYGMLVPVYYKINLIMVIGWPLMFAAVFWWGLHISHRFAGPIERIEEDLDEVLAGHWERRVRLRQKDDLTGVADRINALIDAAARGK